MTAATRLFLTLTIVAGVIFATALAAAHFWPNSFLTKLIAVEGGLFFFAGLVGVATINVWRALSFLDKKGGDA